LHVFLALYGAAAVRVPVRKVREAKLAVRPSSAAGTRPARAFVGIVVAFALRTGFPEAPAFPVIPFVSSLGGIASVL